MTVETLSFGGGILYVKDSYDLPTWIDLGFCPAFSLKIDITEEFEDTYFQDSLGGFIRVPSAIGKINSAVVEGSFTCESFSNLVFNKIWIASNGDANMCSNNLQAAVRALKYQQTHYYGKTIQIIIPACSIRSSSEIQMISENFANLQFSYRGLFSTSIAGIPTVTIS